MRSFRDLVVATGLLVVTVGAACAEKGTMRDQLIAALDRPDRGLRARLSSPVDAGERVVGERYEEGLKLVQELTKGATSPAVRLNALKLWHRLFQSNFQKNRASILRARGYGATEADEAAFLEGAMSRAEDPAADVRVGTLIFLCERYGPGLGPRIRGRFVTVRADLEARRAWPGADRALAVLGGSSDVVKRIQAAAAAGRAPAGFEDDLKQLRREPSAEAVAPLVSLFPRLPVIAGRAAPTAYTVVGSGTTYDPGTRQARDLVLAWAECAPLGDAASALSFLRLATPEMMQVLLIDLPRVPTGLAATIAIAGSGDFPRSVREEAIERIAVMAGDRSDFERSARDGLVALGKHPEVGDLARAALANARRTNPGFSR